MRALEAGDAVARDLLDEAVEALGVAIGSAVTLLDVEAVVVGGGLGERLGPTWLARIEKAAKRAHVLPPPPVYTLAELGDLGGAIGASLLVALIRPIAGVRIARRTSSPVALGTTYRLNARAGRSSVGAGGIQVVEKEDDRRSGATTPIAAIGSSRSALRPASTGRFSRATNASAVSRPV